MRQASAEHDDGQGYPAIFDRPSDAPSGWQHPQKRIVAFDVEVRQSSRRVKTDEEIADVPDGLVYAAEDSIRSRTARSSMGLSNIAANRRTG